MRGTGLAMCSLLPALALTLGVAGPAAAAEPRRYRCVALEEGSAPVIDGRSDPVWERAPWSDPFVDIEGDRRPPPVHRTRFRALWDERALYVLAELEEPHLYATLTEHDAVIFHDPDFEIFLDPEGDRRNYFELEVNALGTTWDLRLDRPYHESGKPDDAWELTGLGLAIELSGSLNDPRDIDSGWTIEMALPWSAFASPERPGRPPREGESWRVNFSRVEWPLEIGPGGYGKVAGACEENWVWSPQGRIDMHRPEQWGSFDFAAAE